LLYINGGRTAYDSYNSYINGVVGNSPNQSYEQSQFLFEAGAFGASTAAIFYIGNPVMGAAIDVGVLALSAKDSICSTHTCKDFSGGQKSVAQILAGIPNGPMADFKLSNPVNRPQGGNGAPIPSNTNGNSGPNRSTAPTGGSGNQGGGGGSYQQLVGLYQSLVSTLTAYVSALSSSNSSGGKH
jgi:hypothetical protein